MAIVLAFGVKTTAAAAKKTGHNLEDVIVHGSEVMTSVMVAKKVENMGDVIIQGSEVMTTVVAARRIGIGGQNVTTSPDAVATAAEKRCVHLDSTVELLQEDLTTATKRGSISVLSQVQRGSKSQDWLAKSTGS